jgi:hypothetical protein
MESSGLFAPLEAAGPGPGSLAVALPPRGGGTASDGVAAAAASVTTLRFVAPSNILGLVYVPPSSSSTAAAAAGAGAGATSPLATTSGSRAPHIRSGDAAAAAGAGGLLVATETAVYRLADDGCEAVLLAGCEGEVGAADGAGPDARFTLILGLTVDGEGAAVLADVR